MFNLLKEQELFIKSSLKKLGYIIDDVELVESSRKDLGQYQFNGIMKLSKQYKKNPLIIAEELTGLLKKNKEYYSNINVAGPGFINITFSDAYLIKYINNFLDNIRLFGKVNNQENKIIIDYGGPNVAKTLHVGHLRSANIGESLKRLSKFLGNTVISDVHLGDWGRPMGLIILELSKRYPEWSFFDENYNGEYPTEININNSDLEKLYPIASLKAKSDNIYLNEAREITTKLQNKEKGYYDLWKLIIEISTNEIKKIYNTLNVSFDLWNGESNSEKYIDDVLDFLDKKGLIYKSDGALVMDVGLPEDKVNIPPLLLKKTNGSISYEMTDLATIWERMKLYSPTEIWYVVDNRQSLHFQQVFRAALKSGIINKETKLCFIGFGTMNGIDGKPFKTRDGNVMTLSNLIESIKKETSKQINENLGDEKEKIIENIAVANLKYADLIPNRATDYIFDPEKFSEMNGKTGVYILYSTVRIKSLLNKAFENLENIEHFYKISNAYVRDIILKLLDIFNVLNKSFNDKSLSEITNYLYQITNLYNSFYSNNKILIEEDNYKKESYLYLSSVVLNVNEILLDILGIAVPDKI